MSWSVGAGLTDRTIIVTGAAGDIGSAITRALARSRARVVASDVDSERLSEIVSSLESDRHVSAAVDVTRPADRTRLVDLAQSDGHPLYGLVHSAAVLRRRSSIADVAEDDWDVQIDTNLKASFFLCREAAEAMSRNGQGRLVLFTSQGWMTGGFGGSTVYAASRVARSRCHEVWRARTGQWESRSTRSRLGKSACTCFSLTLTRRSTSGCAPQRPLGASANRRMWPALRSSSSAITHDTSPEPPSTLVVDS